MIAFQKKAGLEADGKYGDKTHAALMDAVADDDEGQQEKTDAGETPDSSDDTETPKPAGTTVVITSEGGKVNIRCGNGTDYKRITTVAVGTAFDYVATAANGWNAVMVDSQVGWVSGKYSKVVE